MRIKLCSVTVNDQEKALNFYTEKLGFIKKADIPMGEFRWLTVVSPEDPNGTELVLEPNAFPAAKVYQKELHDASIPATAFEVENIHSLVKELAAKGVAFSQEPTEAGPAVIAVFDDTCGNKIQIFEIL